MKYIQLSKHWIMIPLHHFILGITQIQSLWHEQNCCCFWPDGHKSMYLWCFPFLFKQSDLFVMNAFVFFHLSTRLVLYIAVEHHLILNRIQDFHLWTQASIMSLYKIRHSVFSYDTSQWNRHSQGIILLITFYRIQQLPESKQFFMKWNLKY